MALQRTFHWLAQHFSAAFGATVGAYLLVRYHFEEAITFNEASEYVLLGYFVSFVLFVMAKAILLEALGLTNTKYIEILGILIGVAAIWFDLA